ncbi:MAG: histidine phosphatase family protein [Nanoarchaeota archaeon]
MRIIFVRHGQTQWNIDGISQGQQHNPLNETGIRQAKALAKRLAKEHIDVIYSSDLNRTKMTTEQIAAFHPDAPVRYTKELREIAHGIYDGKPGAERAAIEKASGQPLHTFRPQDGESLQDVYHRAVAFYKALIKAHHHGETILCVTHGGLLNMLMLYLHGDPLNDETILLRTFENTSISVVEVSDDKKHKVTSINDYDHLSRKV